MIQEILDWQNNAHNKAAASSYGFFWFFSDMLIWHVVANMGKKLLAKPIFFTVIATKWLYLKSTDESGHVMLSP